jgi:septum formation topological specificity factor MinE
LQVSKGSSHYLSVPRSIKVTAQATQGPKAGMHFQCHAQNRNARRCFASKNDRGTSRAAFSTSSEDNIANADRKENFLERFTRAWSVLFPAKAKPSSNKDIAKQRLKMILVSDRCSVNDEAKKKIVNNIVGALSDFVEIQSEEKVQVDVTSDADLNTVCSITVPVRRVRPEYQEFSRELVNSELKAFDYEQEDGSFRMVDIRFERPDVEDIQD